MLTITRNNRGATRSRGQAMVETLVIVFLALLLLLGIIQFGLIYNAKTILNYATFEAARAGALNYADRRAIEYGLARGLAPLHTSIDAANSSQVNIKAVKRARDELYAEIDKNKGGGEFVCIERLNPPLDAFKVHGVKVKTESGLLFSGEKLIPNDHLKYRSSNPKSDLSIQDANLLKLRVTYCYEMIVPIIKTAIQRLTGTAPDAASHLAVGQSGEPGEDNPTHGTVKAGSFKKNCYAEGRFPIVAQAIVRMQTPARQGKEDDFAQSCE